MSETTNELMIIGAGPAGLLAAIKAAQKGIKSIIIEGRECAGGQLMELYPKKDITDIPGIALIKAEDYIIKLIDEVNHYPELITIRYGHKVSSINTANDGVMLTLDSQENLIAKNVIIATGLGVYKPRTMGLEGENDYSTIVYSLKDYDFLKGKQVVVMGGGDSAIDWANMASKVSNQVTLIHRRNEFRGDISTLQNNKIVKIMTPYIPDHLEGVNHQLQAIYVKNVETNAIEKIPADYILVNYGNIPLSDNFGLPKEGIGIKCDTNNQIKPHLFAIGDAAGYPGKVRRIANAMEEIKKVIDQL